MAGVLLLGAALAQGQMVPVPPVASPATPPPLTTEEPAARRVYADAGAGEATVPAMKPVVQAAEPMTDLQKLANESTGETLALFGRELFRGVPNSFVAPSQTPVLADYLLGPGDEILLRIWGHDNFNGHLTVDRTGAIYIPQIGSVQVAGERFGELSAHLQHELSRTYRNFEFSVSLGRLRSIQIFVLGQAVAPGSYTVSSLSTAFNALLASGGPTAQGSMRRIELRRAGVVVGQIDLYDLTLHGDKTKDLAIQSGDVLFIPFAGPQIAVAGSVRHPAIYECKDETTLAEVLEFAGGPTSTASRNRISVDRIGPGAGRRTISVGLDASSQRLAVHDGDVIEIAPLSSGYEDSVTIRGNLANAGRFEWHAGMKLSEILPDRESLLTADYWRARNELGVPMPMFHAAGSNGLGTATKELPGAEDRAGTGSLADQQLLASDKLLSTASRRVEIAIPVPEIDWSYAVIERLDAKTLRNSLISFHLGRLVNEHDAAEDKLLQPGDVVTILSQADVHVAQDQQTKYVRLEGELASAGTYSVGPDETLADVVRRAGGLTEKAYLFGAAFVRESARVMQQERLDEYLSELTVAVQRGGLTSSNPAAANGQRALLEQMRRMRATGRVVLELAPGSGAGDIPAIPLENGDSFRVPSRPRIVSVIGAVRGQNVFLYNASRRLQDYVELAGDRTRIADAKHAFLIRADGSIVGRDDKHRAHGPFESMPVYPGDTIVIPEKPLKFPALRSLIDWQQMFSGVAGSAATAGVIR